MKISLCMIVHNEEAVIERCLRDFAPVFDELSIVRATGSAKPDTTMEIASSVCTELGKQIRIARYENSFMALQWPHADDFGAARNLSYSISTGDILLWADADDRITPEHAAKLREIALSGEADVYSLPYATAHDRIVMRDRVTRRGVGRWRRTLHERISFTDEENKTIKRAYMRKVGAPVFLHKPLKEKPKSLERNTRILKERLAGVWDDLFYLHQEHFNHRQFEECVRVGRMALAFDQMREEERYGVLCNLAVAAPTSRDRMEWAMQAIELCPWRREAIYTAANISLDMDELENALSFVRMYSHLPRPYDPPWNHRDALYGYQGVQFAAQVFRLNGLDESATKIETELFKSCGAKVSILHATRGRPEQCVQARQEWMRKTVLKGAVEHIFAVDHDDTAVLEAVKMYRHVVVNPGGTTPRAYNAAAAVSCGQVLVLASDDVHPPDGWDALIIQRLGDRLGKQAVLAVSDGHRKDRLLCIQIMDRARYEAQGHAFCEEYESMFADDEFTHRAYRDGIVVEARDIVFEHDHPSFKGDPNWKNADPTYAHTNEGGRYARGKETFLRRNPELALAPS